MNKKKKVVKVILRGLLCLGVLLSVVLIPTIINFGFDVGSGEQSGYIAEIEETGMLWRPPEVRLLNIITTMSTKDTSYEYGIEPEVVLIARQYQKTKTPVNVHYEVRRFVWKWDYANRVIITNILPLNETKTEVK